jgi:Cu+-exporting ATPase
MTGAGRAAELGVLFKDGRVLEAAHDLEVVLLDKTGTVTEGSMSVVQIVPLNGFGRDEVLSLAAAAESGSEHPIARAVLAAARERGLQIPSAREHAVRPGAGAIAVVAGSRIRVGRPDEEGEVSAQIERLGSGGATPFGVWSDDRLAGLIAVSDTVKADAGESISRLRGLGLEVQLVSGDRRSAAEAVAVDLGVDRVVAEVLPDGKAAWVERLRSEGRRVAFVGDGVNDAPALAAADVGIAMGTGTDVALAAADVQLMGGRLTLVPDAIELSRRTFRVIRQNLFWAFAYNVVMIPLAVFGLLTPMWAAAAMAASSVSVVLNALRLRRYRAG